MLFYVLSPSNWEAEQKDHTFKNSLSYALKATSMAAAKIKSFVPALQKAAKGKKLQKNGSYAWMPNTKFHLLEFILSIAYSWCCLIRKITFYRIYFIWWFLTLDPSWTLLNICLFVPSCFSHYCMFPSHTLTLGEGTHEARLADILSPSRLKYVQTQGVDDKHLEAVFF